jgi:hypothetical protein
VTPKSLPDELRELGQRASEIMTLVNRASELPEPLRAGVTDRVLQLGSLLNLLAHEIDVSHGNKLPPDAPFDP